MSFFNHLTDFNSVISTRYETLDKLVINFNARFAY